MMTKNAIVSASLLLVLSLGVFSSLSLFSRGNGIVPENTLPDAIMNDVNATFYNKVGKVSMRIITPQLIHYAHDDTTNFTHPNVMIYHNTPQPWVINADKAIATQGLDNVQFWENVTIHHPASYGTPATLIKTTTLTVHPNLQTAETPALITLIQPNITVNAIGMTADMNSGDIRLLSQARGEYAPTL